MSRNKNKRPFFHSLPAIICKYPWEIFPIEGFHGEKNGDDIHVKIASTSAAAAASKQYIDWMNSICYNFSFHSEFFPITFGKSFFLLALVPLLLPFESNQYFFSVSCMLRVCVYVRVLFVPLYRSLTAFVNHFYCQFKLHKSRVRTSRRSRYDISLHQI